MSYASASDVGALTRNLLGAASAYDTTTCPTLTQVNMWLTTGCAVINSKLAAYGYAAIPTTSGAYGLAQQAEACYGAWMAERSRQSARTGDDERTRAEAFKKDFDYLLKLLSELELDRMGVDTVDATTLLYAGGISISDKASTEAEGDRVKPRFTRDMFKNPESLFPVSYTHLTLPTNREV